MQTAQDNIDGKSKLKTYQKVNLDQNKEFTVTIVRTIEEIEEIRKIWENFHPYPLADIDYFLFVVNLRQEVLRPHVIILWKNGSPETMLVGRIEDVQMKYKISYKVIFKPKVRSLTILNGGILGNTSHDNCTALISELIKSLKQQEADIVSFTEIPVDSPIYKLARTVPGFMFRDHFPVVDIWYRMTLPVSIDDFYKGRSTAKRTKLRSLFKRLEKDYSGNIVIKTFHEMDQIKKFCRDAEEISRKTYQFAYDGGFTCNIEMLHLLNLLSERNYLRAYILYVEGNPCAYWIGILHKNTSYGIQGGTGYNPEYKKYEVGTLLLINMIEDLCNDSQVQFIDFGRGDSFYKQRICDLNWKAADFYIFQPTFKGMRLNIIRSLTGAFQQLGNFILKHMKLREKWIKFNRYRFTPNQNRT